MELVLIRHGQAEERGSRIIDDERELTPKGRIRLKKAVVGLKRLLCENSRFIIISSPLPRALQTAEILADGLGIENLKKNECVSDGNLGSLVSGWDKLDECDCIILVGHEPHLSYWSELICGITLPFKKGAAACVTLNTLKPPSGVLRWFAQPGVLEAIK